MTNPITDPRRLRDGALVLCLAWLILQNSVLLSLAPWERLGVLSTVGSAMLKAVWTLCAPVVSTVLAATLGWAFITGLLRTPVDAHEPARKELRHG